MDDALCLDPSTSSAVFGNCIKGSLGGRALRPRPSGAPPWDDRAERSSRWRARAPPVRSRPTWLPTRCAPVRRRSRQLPAQTRAARVIAVLPGEVNREIHGDCTDRPPLALPMCSLASDGTAGTILRTDRCRGTSRTRSFACKLYAQRACGAWRPCACRRRSRSTVDANFTGPRRIRLPLTGPAPSGWSE